MLTNQEFYIQSLRDHLYYLRSIKEFCLTIELSFYKNNENYINIAKDFAKKCEELGQIAINYTNGYALEKSINSQIYVTDYTLPCELLTEKLFDINIDTIFTKEELDLKPGINPNITDELINNVKKLNEKCLILANNFSLFCQEINQKMKNNELFSYSYLDFFNYIFSDVNTYINDLERIISMESYSPIYAIGYEYNFVTTLMMTAQYIRDWVDMIYEDVFDLASYYVNSFKELIDKYLKASISPDVQASLATSTNAILLDYQTFLQNIIQRLLDKKISFITPPVSLDNIYTSVNFYKFILDKEDKDVK